MPRLSGAREFALERRVLLLKTGRGIGIGISLAVPVEMPPGATLRLCSPEGLIIAGRATDMRDARSVVLRQGVSALDWQQMEYCLAEQAELKQHLRMMERLRHLRSVGSTLPS